MVAAGVSAADDEGKGVGGGGEGTGAASMAGTEVSGGLPTSPSRSTVTFLFLSLANSKALLCCRMLFFTVGMLYV